MRDSTEGKRPVLALTMGDACGIGPEIIVRMWLESAMSHAVVLGSAQVMRRAAEWVAAAQGVSPPKVVEIHDAEDWASVASGAIPVWAPPDLPTDLMAAPIGQVDIRAGIAAAACIRGAVRLAQQGVVAGMVTAPLHKEALALAGEPYPGHTELLQAEGAPPGQPPAPVRMMLANDELKTVLVTIHMSLRQAIEGVTPASVLETIRITHQSASSWGLLKQPRIAVAGLNPHAGEGGLFGDEEVNIIGPAIQAAQAMGIDASGPFAPDTVFMRARNAAGHLGEFDVVVAMYHDQGLIPVKYLGLDHGVNVTLGLPFVRTSPDHGTAFDLAGTGRADASSLMQAWRMARRLIGD